MAPQLVMAPRAALERLGLGEAEAALYLDLLELGRATVGELSSRCAHSRAKIYGLLDNLVGSGVAVEVGSHPRRFAPVDPRQVAAHRLAEVERAAQVAQAKLGPLYRPLGAQMAETRTLHDLEVYKEVERLYDLARERVEAVVAFLRPESPPSTLLKLEQAIERGVKVRVLLPERVDPPKYPYLLKAAELRVAPTPAAGMMIVDESHLLMASREKEADGYHIHGLSLAQGELVRFHRLIFEMLFAGGEPY